jgi:DNA-binding FadR family transcriptional regulator
MFNPDAADQIRVPKVAELMASRIRKAIVTGTLNEGDSLPSETQLMAEFGVSRPTAREGLRILESEGLITVSRGARGGARVTRPNAGIVARAAGLALQTRGVTIKDLYEGRMMIEPPAARSAAERRPQSAAKVLRPHVELEFKMVGDALAVTQAIADFHTLLMEQCGNETVAMLAVALKDVFERVLFTSQSHRSPVPETDRLRQLRFGLKSHARLVDLIEAGDGQGAQDHWVSHMQNAGRVWLSNVGSKGVIDVFG